MDELIKKQAAINEIKRFAGYLDDDMIYRIVLALERLPEAVVPCKDCKRCQNSTVLICGKPKEIFYCDGARKMAVAQYDYCSWAERKEE